MNLLELKLTQGGEEETFVLSDKFTLPKAGKEYFEEQVERIISEYFE